MQSVSFSISAAKEAAAVVACYMQQQFTTLNLIEYTTEFFCFDGRHFSSKHRPSFSKQYSTWQLRRYTYIHKFVSSSKKLEYIHTNTYGVCDFVRLCSSVHSAVTIVTWNNTFIHCCCCWCYYTATVTATAAALAQINGGRERKNKKCHNDRRKERMSR